jgi:uncharacterized protein
MPKLKLMLSVLMTGGTGLIGSALCQHWQQRGIHCTILSRDSTKLDTAGQRFISSLDQLGDDAVFDVIVNLAGAPMAAQRWNKAYKDTLYDSRICTTRALVKLVARLETKPALLLNASAVGVYGHQQKHPLDESASEMPGFSNQLCEAWEREAGRMVEQGVRVCLLRLGVVLAPQGGALAELQRSFKMGVGSWFGSGEQWLSWIHLSDVIAAMDYLLENTDLEGAFNFTAPNPVTAREFCQTMNRTYQTLFSMGVPAQLARLLLGEVADELLLNGQCVVPRRLQDSGFEFAFPELGLALENLI